MDKNQTLLDAANQVVQRKVEEHLQDFDLLLNLADRKEQFLRSMVITSGEWMNNYHLGLDADYKLGISFEGAEYEIEMDSQIHAYAYRVEDPAPVFDTYKETQLLGTILNESNIRQLVAKLDPHSWSPSMNKGEVHA